MDQGIKDISQSSGICKRIWIFKPLYILTYITFETENYKKRITNIKYIDGDNLYGSQMLFDIPIEDYRFEDIIIIKISKKCEILRTIIH